MFYVMNKTPFSQYVNTASGGVLFILNIFTASFFSLHTAFFTAVSFFVLLLHIFVKRGKEHEQNKEIFK